MLRVELFRAFNNRFFMLSVLLGLLSLAYGLSDYISGPNPNNIPGASAFLNNAFDAFIWAENGLFALLAPLMAVLPFSDSFVVDRSQGYMNFILSRSSYRKYLTSKFLSNFLAGGTSLTIPLLILYGCTNVTYPRGFPPLLNARIPYDPMPGPAGHLYRANPDLYILFLIGLAFLFGAVYATLALAISSLVHNRYIALASPFLLYLVANFTLAILRLEIWSPPATLVPHSINSTSWVTVFGELGGIFLVSAFCFLISASKERVYG
jgi:ABC-type transport system involved in multi-copper enzyme maturation permease subunit